MAADTLLDAHRWRGDETVLHMGCGRGLLGIAAARRVPRGRISAIDRWQESDLSGNTPAALIANATAAGVVARITVDTGDARVLPDDDAAFDIVGSMTVIHNSPTAEDRAGAIAEMWRVLKPGGRILLWGVLGWRLVAAKPGFIGSRGAAERPSPLP